MVFCTFRRDVLDSFVRAVFHRVDQRRKRKHKYNRRKRNANISPTLILMFPYTKSKLSSPTWKCEGWWKKQYPVQQKTTINDHYTGYTQRTVLRLWLYSDESGADRYERSCWSGTVSVVTRRYKYWEHGVQHNECTDRNWGWAILSSFSLTTKCLHVDTSRAIRCPRINVVEITKNLYCAECIEQLANLQI